MEMAPTHRMGAFLLPSQGAYRAYQGWGVTEGHRRTLKPS
jgi:hypothetical protein